MGYFERKKLKKYNQNHDDLGRFSSGDGGSADTSTSAGQTFSTGGAHDHTDGEAGAMATRINDFASKVEQYLVDYYKANGPSFYTPKIEVSQGPKYTKLTKLTTDAKSGTAFAFIDNKTGDIYMPGGASKPAKGVRGNIATMTPEQIGARGEGLYRRR